MTVKELMEILSGCNQNAIVVMSKDSEGNRFSPLSGWGQGGYIRENDRYGEIVNEGDIEEGDGSVDAIVLWPTN